MRPYRGMPGRGGMYGMPALPPELRGKLDQQDMQKFREFNQQYMKHTQEILGKYRNDLQKEMKSLQEEISKIRKEYQPKRQELIKQFQEKYSIKK